jgi:hypothetical protein
MSTRFVVLCSDPPDERWRERFVEKHRRCDWWISAEWAGIEDDDEAEALADPLANAEPVVAEDSVSLDFGTGGRLRVHAIGPDEVAAICATQGGPDSDCEHGLVFDLSDGTGILAAIVAEALQAIGIGMAGSEGWVLGPSGAWWDVAERSWLYPLET